MDKLFIPRKNYMELDEVRNYLAIERWANRLQAAAGGGDRDWGTVVVAAANTHAGHNAHFICDGVADQVEVQAAVDSLPAGKGQVVLLEGDYNFNGTVVVGGANISIRGMGMHASVIYTPVTAFDVIGGTALFTHLGFTGTGTNPATPVGILARDCAQTWVVECSFVTLGVGIDFAFCVS
jgi:hypothetical protein